MLAEERALTSGELWTETRIGDWRRAWNTHEHPDASEEALPRGEDGRRSVLLGASGIAHCFGNTHRTRGPAVGRGLKPVGKPDAGNPHVRFDERGRETERCRMAQATAPVLDSTMDGPSVHHLQQNSPTHGLDEAPSRALRRPNRLIGGSQARFAAILY